MHFLISKLSWNDTVFFVKFFNTLPEISANCPSDQCWTYDATTDTCTVKSGAECGYSLTCGGDSMSFDFPEELFGTDNPVNFVEHDGCHPTVQVDFWKIPIFIYLDINRCFQTDGTLDWTNPLGTCGTQMTQVGNKIIVTKTLCIDPDIVDVDGYQLQLEVYYIWDFFILKKLLSTFLKTILILLQKYDKICF